MTDLAADLDDIHPLLVHVHAGNALHLASGNVTELKDFGGLKIRSPSRTGAWMLEALGAEPVGMPVPALPQALAKKTVDAGLVPFEVAIPLKLADLTMASVELNGGARFGTSTFLFAMNKGSYASLPPDLQAIVDDVSGRVLSEAMGVAWNEMEPLGKERARAAGATVSALSVENTADFDAPFQKVADRWVSEVSSIGIDGAELLERARAAVAAHSK
jgi:TRAP-type C4-dicarboxylate transport system substrate-binding protein